MRDRKITLNIMLPSKYSYMIQTFLPPFPFPLSPLPISLTLSLPLSTLCFLPPSPPEKTPEPLGGLQMYLPQGIYGARLLFFVSARTNKRHHHHLPWAGGWIRSCTSHPGYLGSLPKREETGGNRRTLCQSSSAGPRGETSAVMARRRRRRPPGGHATAAGSGGRRAPISTDTSSYTLTDCYLARPLVTYYSSARCAHSPTAIAHPPPSCLR